QPRSLAEQRSASCC
ncbi:putative small GTPase Rab2, partial [Toxoplasma gondii GAB2-2007-GAL-DOM2]